MNAKQGPAYDKWLKAGQAGAQQMKNKQGPAYDKWLAAGGSGQVGPTTD